MYDVDGNGVIDQDEMTKIVQVDKNLNDFCSSSKLYQFNGFYSKLSLKVDIYYLYDIKSHQRSEVWRNIWSGDLWHAGGWVHQTNGHCWGEGKEYLQQVFKKCFEIYFNNFNWFCLKDGRKQWWHINRGGVPQGLPHGDKSSHFSHFAHDQIQSNVKRSNSLHTWFLQSSPAKYHSLYVPDNNK